MALCHAGSGAPTKEVFGVVTPHRPAEQSPLLSPIRYLPQFWVQLKHLGPYFVQGCFLVHASARFIFYSSSLFFLFVPPAFR